MLPISNNYGKVTPFLTSLFTATSATCVTGLALFDTGTYWSLFGKIVILIMIQIGGLGVVTMTMALIGNTGRKISLFQRSLTQDSISAEHAGGIMKMVNYIIRITLFFEILGGILLSFVFVGEYGLVKGVAYGMFHSISAFCNAGFDLIGHFNSFTGYVDNIYFNVVIMALIIFGGIGFYTWQDIKTHKFNIRKYSLQSRIILYVSGLLIVIPALYFFFFEFRYYGVKERVLASLFQSVTSRTAGFNTVAQGDLSDSASLITIILMLIGGSPGSTAGGMKTTTIAVLFISSIAVFNQTEDAHTKTRRISDSTIKAASAIFLFYIVVFITSAIIICSLENLRLIDCLFETASALGTVGITRGITPGLRVPAKVILIFLMIFGRVGIMTIIYATLPRVRKEPVKLPLSNISVG